MSVDSIKAALDGVDHSFEGCRTCWNFIEIVATHNLILVPISTLMGRKDVAISASKRVQNILSDKNLPAATWYRLRYIELLGAANISSMYGDQKGQGEYYEKAIEHLKRGLATGAFPVDRYLELARREIERTTFVPPTKTDSDVKQKLSSVSRIVSDSVGRTKGFEYEHADMYISLSQAYLKAGLGKDSELILQRADDVLSKLSAHSGSVRFLESRGKFLEALGYQRYYRGDFSGANEIVRAWDENVKLRDSKGLFVDLSAPIELKARIVLLSGGCEKFEVAVLEARLNAELDGT